VRAGRGGKAVTDRERARMKAKGDAMTFLWILGLLVAWFALQMWVLPRFGVPT